MTWASGGAAAIVAAAVALGACAHESPPPPLRAPAAAGVSACHHALPSSPPCAGAAPTYAGDVRPILERRCLKCHAGDGVAADEHDFSHVGTLRAQKIALANEIGACAMPPTPEPPVPDAEAEVLLRWVACGGKE